METVYVIYLYILSILLFLVLPFFAKSEQRRNCLNRCSCCGSGSGTQSSQRRETEAPGTGNASQEEGNAVWEKKQLLLLKSFDRFTKVLTKEDFCEFTSINKQCSGAKDISCDDSALLMSPAASPRSICKNVKLTATFPISTTENDTSCSEDMNKCSPELDDIMKDFDDTSTIASHLTVPVTLPLPGLSLECGKERRDVPGTCAVCLCNYTVGDRVIWSSNPLCPHVFHEECIIQWLFALLEKQRRREYQAQSTEERRQQRSNRREVRQDNVDVEQTANRVDDANDGNDGNDVVSTSSDSVDDDVDLEDGEMLEAICKECPCCRQDFVVPVKSGVLGSEDNV
mmetsp:Transcript_11730/g.14582  ORF Transcript_11730/g.14582 Transcript_11730/m.14582 type:complete len:342 (+) Transcript_11730:134-1159(+)|eukprot:CAMPEP_0172499926 /NCGR_PEP_ID=MMETSP1066-20121228/132468_1 /TAXON_ID=671091 /ORGANISM="Coscinodiscus wailesii, Strain CCMP2513" /LENGTH=341 /DNA_ID=CAMNT_0013273919 /DNA_START=96 /DNA_END=1121 /DNA_ORIENTATION=+